MKIKNILKHSKEQSGSTTTAIARALSKSPSTVNDIERTANPKTDSVIQYLEAVGYSVYVVPSSLHVEAISDEAIKVEANKPAK